ncbi:alkaline phosphatase family protein [Chloroflexota bacterium]
MKIFAVSSFILISALLASISCSNLPPAPAAAPELTPRYAPATKSSPTSERLPQNVLVIGWDGCGRAHLDECIARGEVPHLMELTTDGALVGIDILRNTATKAGWSAILTGYYPEKTGVFTNSIFQPIPAGYTVFERLEEFFGPDNIVTAGIIGKTGHVGNASPQKIPVEEWKGKNSPSGGKKIMENGHEYWDIPGEPFYRTQEKMDFFINGLGENDKVGELALETLEKHQGQRMFLFIHFAEPDHAGHAHGENSKEYNDAIISDDQWLGKIVGKLKELGLYDKTLIYVTADHGFDLGKKSHSDAPFAFLATNDSRVIRRGHRIDIAPTILKRLGLDISQFEPPLDGHPLIEPYQPTQWAATPDMGLTTLNEQPKKKSPVTYEMHFDSSGNTSFGDWYADTSLGPASWQPGLPLNISTTLRVSDSHLAGLAKAGINADGFCLLITAERTFDSNGWLRLASDEKMSTLLTPTGLAIEGGVQGAVTDRFAYEFRTPVDELLTKSLDPTQKLDGERQVTFDVQTSLPEDLPPGIYRIRLDYGITVKKRYYGLNGASFAYRPFSRGEPMDSHLYSLPIRASGPHVSGRWVDATTIQPRIPWVLLSNYNSNGYRGVIADEDRSRFALSSRNIIPDGVILPLYTSKKTKASYSLEPQFPTDTIDARSNIPWDYTRGELSIQVTGPDGDTVDLGTAPFIGKKGLWPTTKHSAFTKWEPSSYGHYTVKATGWIEDTWGNRYEGGGTYNFWIANRMTLATATFQGYSYPVGSTYGRSIAFAPAVPADVEVNAALYANSDVNDTRTVSYSGRASPSGVFGPAQGAIPLPLDSPGEYHAHILARYTDEDGHLWVSTMRHAGIVYPEGSPIVARGKKLYIKDEFVDRGETMSEGYVETDGTRHLVHINYPFQAGDVLLIASEQQGANKIEPVLTYEDRDNPAPYAPRLKRLGATNLCLRTSNGYSPHLFPEYITDWAYYYAGAPRPGFMSRFLVGEEGVRAPYWPTSPNSFGGQINASSNGDLPGDIYRLVGGVVVRKEGAQPAYAGYLSSAFLLPKDSNNNRIIAPGTEDLIGPNGNKARFFLIGTRPGMMYETDTSFVAAVQVDPILPVKVTYILEYPDGRRVTAEGVAGGSGVFVGKEKWLLDIPGVYRYTLEAEWQGFKGYMPGLPREGGEFYVVERDIPSDAPVLSLDLPEVSTFNAAGSLTIKGSSTAQTVHFAAVIPGAVVDQGTLTVNEGKFEYRFNPVAINQTTPTYDITNLRTGKPDIKEVVHLTFFAAETTPTGETYHSFIRVIIRGTTVIYAR